MNALFDSAALATVAYAEVVGADGSSTRTNSGVTTTRQSLGTYSVALQTNMTQNGVRDLIFIQPKMATGVALNGVIHAATVNDDADATKLVQICNATTAIDSDFSIWILRTVIPPPAGAPA
jgi:hypothetical protein